MMMIAVCAKLFGNQGHSSSLGVQSEAPNEYSTYLATLVNPSHVSTMCICACAADASIICGLSQNFLAFALLRYAGRLEGMDVP